MAEPLSDDELQEYDQYHPNEWTEQTESRLRATIRQDWKRIAELERQLEQVREQDRKMETALRAARTWIMEVLREENEASPENTHTIRMIDAGLTEGKEHMSEADLPTIQDVCGLWEDEKDQSGG